MKIFDPDKGLRGLLVHHEPINDIQMKRLLLAFDEINFTSPSDQTYFLEEGAICYYYDKFENGVNLYSLNGFEMQKRFSNTPKPEIPKNTLPVASFLSYGGNQKIGDKAYQAILINNILPYYQGNEFMKQEEILFDKFEKAIEKKNIKILDYKETDFYQRNSIPLKIAYDFDVCDNNSLKFIKPLLQKNGFTQTDMFIPSPPLPELKGTKVFPLVQYTRVLNDTKEAIENDFERQYFSIIGKVNKKLALSDEFDLTPIFIDPNIHNFYQYKISKSKNNQDIHFHQEWNKYYDYKLMNLNNLIIQSSEIYVKDEILLNLSVQQILSYKERCIDELYSLRRGLASEINNLKVSDFKNLNSHEIENLIKKKLVPDFIKYQKSQNEILSKVIKGAVKYSVGIGSAYVGFVQGLSPLLITLLAGASPNIVDDLLKLSGKLREKKNKRYENTFSYYLNLNKR